MNVDSCSSLPDDRDADIRGRRIRVVACTDPHTTLPAGLCGTVVFVDGLGTVHVRWDDGRTLGLVPDLDQYELLDPPDRPDGR